LAALYDGGALRNEFDDWTVEGPPVRWGFTHYSKGEFGRHQRRKLIYALYASDELGQTVKVEFEPVRRWEEIDDGYGATVRIENLGRVDAVVEVVSDDEAGFMPSIYPVELREIDGDVDPGDLRRVVSYMEEFRLQVEAGERALVRGNLSGWRRGGGCSTRSCSATAPTTSIRC
ncbi:MAG: hypothetical protein ACE5OO_08780, partial [Candidatus Bathyarchaeia archaeon]